MVSKYASQLQSAYKFAAAKPIVTTLTGDRQRTQQAFKNLFPGHSPEKVARAAGALDGSEVTFSSPSPDIMSVRVQHPHLEAYRIFQKIHKGGKPHLIVEHAAQVAEKELKGSGYSRFKDVIGHLQDIGVHGITISTAAGSREAADNGYYTWPRFGFQADLDKHQREGLPTHLKTALEGDHTFHKLFSVPGGSEYWKEHGGEIHHMRFDLTPGSEHLKHFENYHARRETGNRVRESAEAVGGGLGSGSGDATGSEKPTQGTAATAGIQRFTRSLTNTFKENKPAMKPLKFEAQKPHHPIVAGYRIARVLQHLSKSPESTENVRLLSKRVLHDGDTTALRPLYDSLQDQGHPLAHSYNWPNAEWKLHLDAAVGKALDAVAGQHTQHGMPEPEARSLAHRYVQNANAGVQRGFLQSRGYVDPGAHTAATEAIGILHGLGHSPEDIAESLNRHAARTADQKPNSNSDEKALSPEAPRHPLEKATRYSKESEQFSRTPNPKRGNFLAALKRVQSAQQSQLRGLANDLYKQSGLTPVTVKDAIHDNSGVSSANTASVLYHDSQPDLVRKIAAEYGLASQSPALLQVHVGEGQDSVHKVSVRGSGEGLLKQLDRHGFSQRTLVPNKTGYDVFLFDPQSQLHQRVQDFASKMGSPVQSAKGTGEILGAGDDSTADSETRKSYRSILRGNQQQQQPSTQPPIQQGP